MAYHIRVKGQGKTAEMVERLVERLPTESYPNGNGGYHQESARQLAKQLAPLGIAWKTLSAGNAYCVGVYAFIVPKRMSYSDYHTLAKMVWGEKIASKNKKDSIQNPTKEQIIQASKIGKLQYLDENGKWQDWNEFPVAIYQWLLMGIQFRIKE